MTTDVSSALETLQLDPDNNQALKALAALHPGNGSGVDRDALAHALTDARRWHRERGDFELCVQLIDLELAWTTEPARRADLLHEKARILSDELLRDREGQACVSDALAAVPDHAASLESQSQMSLVQSNWEPISKRYLQQAETATDKALASSLFGSVAEFNLKYGTAGAGEAAGERYLRRSLELDPRNRRSSLHLERVLRDAGKTDDLLALYASRAEQAGTREERALAEVASGELLQKAGRAAEALAFFRKALEANAVENRALRPVVAALTASESWADLAKILEPAVRSKRGETDVALAVDLATLLWKKTGQTREAEIYFRRVRKLDPSNRAMVDFYREYFTARNEQPQLLTLLAQAQKTETDVERRVAMGVEMARAAELRAQTSDKTVDKAIDIWKGLLRLQPHLPEAVEALKRLYTRTEKWNALLEVLKEDLETVPAGAVDEKVNRYLEIVAIYRDRLNLDVMVVNTYLSIIALKPDHPAALAALASRYEAQGRWSDLIQILTRQAEASADTAQRLALHRRVAALWSEKLGKHHNAVASLEKILESDPSDSETCDRLKELYTRSRSWRPLLDVFKKELPYLPAERRRGRLVEMARLAADRLNETREAIGLWNQVLALADHDADALAGLAGLYERDRRWAALIEILDRQRKNAGSDGAAELPLLERQGTLLFEKLGAARAAAEIFRRIQVLQPGHARAVRALREIYAQAGDFPALEALYLEQGAFADLCDQLTGLADRTSDLAARTRLLERVALLSLEKLNQPERALKAYERILATDPQNRRAAMALIPLYRAAQKWPRLLATYEVLVGPAATGDGGPTAAEQLQLLKEARRICEQRLSSKALAFQWCARAYAVAPTDAEVTTDLERLAAEADEWGALAGLFGGRLESAKGTMAPEERLGLLRRSLRIALGRLYKPSDARRFAEEILAATAGRDDEAEAALEQILTQTKAWPDLAKLLHARADRATDPAERLKMLFRIAQFEEEKVGDLAAAAATLKSVFDVDAASAPAQVQAQIQQAHERALKSLVRVMEARQDWPGLLEALRRDLDARPAEDREDLLLRIGQIQETRLGDAAATFATYRTVLQANPQNAAAVAGLERLAAAGHADVVEIAGLALPFYERTDAFAKQAAAHESLLAATRDATEQRARLEKLRALYGGPLRDAASAYRTALRLFDLDPADRANREQLIQFAAETQALPDLTEQMRAAANATDDAALRRDLLAQIAELHEQRLGRAGDAEKVYAEILALDPLNAGAFRSLARLYREAERWADLRALIESRQALVKTPSERLDLLAQTAEIDETVLDDTDHAIACYEQMLQVNPADLRAHRALDRHYAARERWKDLEQLLGTRVSFAPAAEGPEIDFRRAELRASRLGDVDGALDLIESIVRSVPTHEGARRLLEKLITLPDQRLRVARILEPLYEAGAAWSRLVAVLEIQREPLQGADAAAMLARIADLQETKLQARAAALATWRQVLAVEPTHADALVEIERLATALERFSELVDVYQELAFSRDTSDISGRADLLSRAARLYGGRLGNRRAAIDAWKLVLNLDVDNLATAKPAAAALEGLYAETGDVASLVKILRQQSRWADKGDDRKALLFRIASLEEKSLGDTTAAVATLRSVLEIDPQNREAIDSLERIFEAGANHRQRVEMLRRRIDLAQDAGARQELWRRVASLLERDVGDVDEAIAACVSILDENPEDVTALETLARLYEKQGRHRDRLGILERRLALVERAGGAADAAAHADVLRQIAGLYEGPLGDPASALQHWREILAISAADAGAMEALERFLQPGVDTALRVAAAQALEPIYDAEGRWPELADVVQVYVEAQDDPRARVAELSRLAALQETRLRDAEAAFRSYGLAIRDAISDSSLPSLLDAYERLGAVARRAEVAALYRDITPDVLDEKIRLRLDRFVAESARAAGDRDVAAEYYRRVLDRVPEDDTALGALEQLYAQAGDAQALYDVLTRRAELAKEPGAERRLRAQMGALAESPLGRADEAIAAWERVMELAPHDRDAMQALDRLYTAAERWADLTRFLSEIIERGLPEREVVAVRYRLAQIEHDRQHDKEGALDHLRAVLRSEPAHAGAIAMLEGMLDDIAVQGPAAELLEPVYAGRGDWPALIRIGEIRLVQVEDAAERLAWTKRIARLYEEQLEDYDSALRWYGKVFQEAPTEAISAEQLLRLAGKLGRWKDVGNLFADYLGGELGDGPAVLEITRRAAEIFDLRVGDRDEARKYYRRLYDARPDDREAAVLFENALERWESWLELRELTDEQASRAVDPTAKVAFLRRSARLDEERLDDKSRAMTTLREILDLDPTDLFSPSPDGGPPAAAELERLLRGGGEWLDLSAHLTFMLDRAPEGRERDAVALRLADVLENKLSDLSGAIDRYAEIVERAPGSRDAVGALERLLQDPDHRYRVAVILEPIYRKAGDWQKLVAVLEAQLDTVEDRDDRVKILGEMAGIYQRLARIDLAFGCRSRAWLVDVSSADALAEMESLATSAKLFSPLVQTLEKGAVEAGDPSLQARLWGLTARLIEEHLGDPGKAIEAWRQALGARPDDVDAFLALERLLTAAARLEELVEVLERHLEIATDPADRKLLAKRIAVLYELALKQRDQAIRAWQNVLEIDDADREALDALAQLFLANAGWRELAEIYERKIALTPGVSDRRLLRLQASRLYDDKLGEASEAVNQLRAILDESQNDREALDGLDKVFTREGRHADLLEVLDLRMAAEAVPAAREELAFRAARLVETELSDVEGAIARYREILSPGRAPQHADARAALWAIARGSDYRLQAVGALDPILRASRDWAGVVELLELRLEVEDVVAGRLQVLAEIARLEEDERRDPARAFAAWARAITEEATEAEPRHALERLAAASGDYRGLADVYEERMEATFDAGLQRSLAVRLADLYEAQLGDLHRAGDFLRKALSLPGDEAAVLAALDRVLRKLGAHEELAETLAREAEVAVDPTEQADFLSRLGDTRLVALDDAEGAIAAYRSALERAPDHEGAHQALHQLLGRDDTREGALDILEPMAEGRGDYGELVTLFEHRLSLHQDRAERAHWLRRIAEVHDGHLGDAARAVEALGRALKEEPMPGAALDEIERIAGAGKIPTDAARRIEAVLGGAEPDAARELALRAARLYEQSPSGRADAERLYARVLESDPENIDALTALEGYYRASGDAGRIASILERRAAIEFDPQARKRLLLEAAALHEKLGALPAAIAALQTVRSAEEGDAQILGELARLYEGSRQLPELTEVLGEWARFAEEPAQRAALYARIGEIKLGPLADLAGAADSYREALEAAPEDPKILSALEAIAERLEDWSTLQDVLMRRLGATVGPAQVAVLQKLARNAEQKLEDLEQSIGFLHQILEIDGTHAAAFRELERLLAQGERWYDLVDVLTKHAEAEAGAGRKPAELALRVQIADVWEQKLGSADSAAEALEKVLEVAPTHVAALLSLARLHEGAERWDEAGEALQRAAAAATSGEEAAEIQFRNAQILRAREAPAEEIEALLLRALESDQTHRPTLLALEAIARQANDQERLVQILELLLDTAPDAAEQKARLAEIASLYGGPLGRPADAIGPLQRLVQLAPDDVAPREQLAEALLGGGHTAEAAQLMVQIIDQLTRAKRGKEVARYHQRLGAIAESRGDLPAAGESYTSAYKLDPGHPATLAALGRLALREGDIEKARKFYRSLLLQNFDEATSGVSKAEVYLALGRIHVMAREIPKARNMFERGLENDPKNELLKQALASLPAN
jgi:tetratricopeptide (TPR) repeat protein